MKSLTSLLKVILTDVSMRCGTDTQPDCLTAIRRVENEGLSFLTITLPSFCKDFERSLSQGGIGTMAFLGFKKSKSRPALPAFLQGLLSQIFDSVEGSLLDNPNIDAIFAVRQVTLLFKKVNMECDNSRVVSTYLGFVKTDKEIPSPNGCDQTKVKTFNKVASIVCGEAFSKLSSQIANYELIPRHGPGVTAEKIRGNAKYHLKRWHDRLNAFFPFDQFGVCNPNWANEESVSSEVSFVSPDQEDPVRVITVPKTMKAPRIIAIEPVCMQYVQQALSREITSSLEKHELTAGSVNFTDQAVNRKIALESSKSGRFATLDLSEASDRVPSWLVYDMLNVVPLVRDAVFSCRSTRANLPIKGYSSLRLNKFASMGSALCFPIESVVFYTILLCAVMQGMGLPPTRRNIVRCKSLVKVYGDDLIVPVDHVQIARDWLEAFGLRVNLSKTFGAGKFRESCGMDAYDGHDVTPCYLRSLPPTSKHSHQEIVSYVSFANHLYEKGWWQTARYVRSQIEVLLGPLPIVEKTSPCLGWHTLSGGYDGQRWGKLHSFEVKSYVVFSMYRDDPLQGHSALMKCLLPKGDKPFGDTKHLERSVRSGSVRIRRRWALPF